MECNYKFQFVEQTFSPKQLNTSNKSSYFQLRKRLLFSFAYDQKGATNYDKTERENPRGSDRRD